MASSGIARYRVLINARVEYCSMPEEGTAMTSWRDRLDGAQERLLVDLVEAARTLPESQETDFVGTEPPGTNGRVLLRHPGLPAGYETHALHLVVLEEHGCIRMRASGPGTHSIGLLPAAAECHEEITRLGFQAEPPAWSMSDFFRSVSRRADPRTPVSPADADVVARCLEILERPGLHRADRANVMTALTGYLLKNVLKAPPEALGVWLRALPHAAGDRMLVEHIEGEDFPDGTFGAWIKRAFRELTGPTRDTPTS
jgi:hypothetical protein